MQKDFNPTKQDLLTLDELILNIKSKKNKLIITKMSFQNTLSELKSKYEDTTFNSKKFHEIKKNRQVVKNHLNSVELQLRSLNEELNFKNKLRLEVEYFLTNNKNLEGKVDLDKISCTITSLKTKYTAFTKDRTRIASLRIMAAEFIDELDALIK